LDLKSFFFLSQSVSNITLEKNISL